MNDSVEIIKEQYHALGFDKRLDAPFYELLVKESIDPTVTAMTASLNGSEGQKTALTLLYLSYFMKVEYIERGIDEEMYERMISGIKGRIENTYLQKGSFAVGDCEWYRLFLAARLFRIGRLWFDLKPSPVDIPSKQVKKGDNIVGIHVPGGEPLCYDACVRSISDAKAFISMHFPDFNYRYMTCISWLLDDSIRDLLGENSNILKFATLFEIVSTNKSDGIIRFVFGNGAKREDLPSISPAGRFKTALREQALAGRVFYDRRGVIDINKIG